MPSATGTSICDVSGRFSTHTTPGTLDYGSAHSVQHTFTTRWVRKPPIHAAARLAVGVARSEPVILDRVSLSLHMPASRFYIALKRLEKVSERSSSPRRLSRRRAAGRRPLFCLILLGKLAIPKGKRSLRGRSGGFGIGGVPGRWVVFLSAPERHGGTLANYENL